MSTSAKTWLIFFLIGGLLFLLVIEQGLLWFVGRLLWQDSNMSGRDFCHADHKTKMMQKWLELYQPELKQAISQIHISILALESMPLRTAFGVFRYIGQSFLYFLNGIYQPLWPFIDIVTTQVSIDTYCLSVWMRSAMG